MTDQIFTFQHPQGFVPGMLGVSHGALQFMTYEEMKNRYNQYRKLPIDTKLVRLTFEIAFMEKKNFLNGFCVV